MEERPCRRARSVGSARPTPSRRRAGDADRHGRGRGGTRRRRRRGQRRPRARARGRRRSGGEDDAGTACGDRAVGSGRALQEARECLSSKSAAPDEVGRPRRSRPPPTKSSALDTDGAPIRRKRERREVPWGLTGASMPSPDARGPSAGREARPSDRGPTGRRSALTASPARPFSGDGRDGVSGNASLPWCRATLSRSSRMPVHLGVGSDPRGGRHGAWARLFMSWSRALNPMGERHPRRVAA